MSKYLTIGLLLAASQFPGAVFAQADQAPTRASVRQLLSGIEDVPSDAELHRIGPRIVPVLIALYNDPSEAPFVRMRAVDASAAFPQAGIKSFLLAVAHTEGQSDLFIRRALLSLARAFGASASTELASFLSHEEPVVREAAARGLGMVQGEPARSALRTRLGEERDATVRTAIQRALEAAR